MANMLDYSQKPLAPTHSMEYLKFRELPVGQNAIVAILCYSGYMQDDSVIMNYSSNESNEVYSEKKSGFQQLENLEKPLREDTLCMKHGTYDKLEDDGLVAPGTGVRGEDIIIGKTASIPLDRRRASGRGRIRGETFRCRSRTRRLESGAINQVSITTNSEGQKFVKVRVRSMRITQIGDKVRFEARAEGYDWDPV
ncbi:DNA-dependent RNA polymerase II, partial [Marasmius sp. AFHP31]